MLLFYNTKYTILNKYIFLPMLNRYFIVVKNLV